MSISYNTKMPDDGWIKIFRHHISGGYWSSASDWAQVKNYTAEGYNGNKFSLLYKLNDSMKINGEFIFKLVMPAYTNIWAQTHNPLLDAPSAATVPGYRAISVQTTANSWGGLSKSDSTSSFIDGYPANSSWYYPLGSVASWNGGLPLYSGTGEQFIELWVKLR